MTCQSLRLLKCRSEAQTLNKLSLAVYGWLSRSAIEQEDTAKTRLTSENAPMTMFWIFLLLVVVIVAGNALTLLRTARSSGANPRKADRDDQSV